MTTSIICTVGPSSRRENVLEHLEELGVSLFRINLSHTAINELPEVVRELRDRTQVPICLDSEGAQVRTGGLESPWVDVRDNELLTALEQQIAGNAEVFSFYPPGAVERLEIGDLISIDFDAVLVQVVERRPGQARLRVLHGGQMGPNKAVTVQREFPLPALTMKDRQALRIGSGMGVECISLSFASSALDVDEIRAVFGRPTFVISKIESIRGLRNLDEIVARSDAVLIDRGDLSREVPIERIPAAQKGIIRCAKANAKPVYVATNLLESMTASPHPTRAEVNDVYNTLMDGADGLVLAAETAVGRYPVGCVRMVRRIVNEVGRPPEELHLGRPSSEILSFLVEPHGGKLVTQEADDLDRLNAASLPRLAVDPDDLMDCEQIARGTYSPLIGFMDAETLRAVLAEYRLPDGTVWPLPIILQAHASEAKRLSAGGSLLLTAADGTPHARLEVTSVFALEVEEIAKAWFGTTSANHPGVARFHRRGTCCLAGRVTLLQGLPPAPSGYYLPPTQTRQVFAHKGWARVVGFHTRNVCHRVHEYIQLEALRRSHADGIYISPVIGTKKVGDFTAEAIMGSYHILLTKLPVFPAGKAMLGGFRTYSRYAGPREAVFTALCRKNMGCSHFVVGRDHTGVGDYYSADANRRLFDRLGDLGITPVWFENIGYSPTRRAYEPHRGDGTLAISGTELRQALWEGRRLPEWFIRPELQEFLLSMVKSGQQTFVA